MSIIVLIVVFSITSGVVVVVVVLVVVDVVVVEVVVVVVVVGHGMLTWSTVRPTLLIGSPHSVCLNWFQQSVSKKLLPFVD